MKNGIKLLWIVLTVGVTTAVFLAHQKSSAPVPDAGLAPAAWSDSNSDSDIQARWPSPLRPPQRGDLDWMNRATNARLQEIAEKGGWPEGDVPTVEHLQAGFFSRLLDEIQSESTPDDVAAALATEMRSADDAGSREQTFSQYASLLALPYLVEAGLCRGSVWSEEGLICAYVDESGTSRNVYGRHVDPATGEVIQRIRRPPAGSEFARILRKARRLHAEAGANLIIGAAPKRHPVLSKLAALLNVVAPPAHAQASPEEAVCYKRPQVSTTTVVARQFA